MGGNRANKRGFELNPPRAPQVVGLAVTVRDGAAAGLAFLAGGGSVAGLGLGAVTTNRQPKTMLHPGVTPQHKPPLIVQADFEPEAPIRKIIALGVLVE